MRLVIVTILCALLPMPAYSAPPSCKEYVKSQRAGWWVEERTVCYCGSQLSNLTVTLPPGLRVEAVCSLRFDTGAEQHDIDLTRERLSLDNYRHGDYPKGGVFLSGTTQNPVSGTVTMSDDPYEGLSFSANGHNRRGPVFWESHLKRFSLGTEEHYKQLRAPKQNEARNACWEAEATIRIRNPAVLLGDSDEAGTTADLDVIHVSEYKPCKKREIPEDPVSRLSHDQPSDVVELITRIGMCNWWQGDWPYADEETKKEIAAELAKLNCAELPNEEKKTRANYVGNAKVNEAIDAAKTIEY